ncbi:MAG: 1-acyl-sn-glycerol-3-phosphate acyltransferase [Chloroflexi bacterium]|nr:1-acyl-sn-glycerol-3-phosphate acyltransferase [Chloroflexota bacterium]
MSLIQAYRRFVVLLAKFLFTIYIRKFEVVGREHVPLEGPLILASNHVNNVDPPAITLAVPRFPMFMAKQEMTTWPILGPAIRMFGAFPVRRGGADLAAIRAASEVVNEGNMVVMFPEGTRSRTGGLTKGHPGTALIALRTGAPILPVAVTGTETIAWPWLFIKPLSIKHVKVTIGEPFRLPPVERIDGDAAAAATGVIMRRIAALLPPQHRGVYADIEGETTPAETD